MVYASHLTYKQWTMQGEMEIFFDKNRLCMLLISKKEMEAVNNENLTKLKFGKSAKKSIQQKKFGEFHQEVQVGKNIRQSLVNKI